MAFLKPRQRKGYRAFFEDVGTVDEVLKITWYDSETNTYGPEISYIVGQDVFLEDPTTASDVPTDQIVASISMGAILAGSVVPGTQEFSDMFIDQETRFIQSIAGDLKLQSVTLFEDPNQSPGTIYDLVLNRKGQTGNTVTLRADQRELSDYTNRVNSFNHSHAVIPGALHKQFGYKKSQLGAEGSAARLAVIEYVANTCFWV